MTTDATTNRTTPERDSVLLFNELVTLRTQAGKTLHARLVLADKLLRRPDWIAYRGGEIPALEFLEQEAFGDVTGLMHLSDLLELIRREPSEATWRQYKYNVRSLLAEVRKRDRASRPAAAESEPADPELDGSERREQRQQQVFQSLLAQRDLIIKQLKAELAGMRRDLAQSRKESQRLRRLIGKIRGELNV